MGMTGNGPHPDPFTLSDVGRGHLGRGRSRSAGRPILLERRAGAEWIEVERFTDGSHASVALDETLAAGGSPDAYRLRVLPPSTRSRVLAVVGVTIFVILALAAISVVAFAH